jgi:murein tripeptide amidase MpaA
VTGVKGKALTMDIINANIASYPNAWHGYNACYSYDRKIWRRVATQYDAVAGRLSISHTPDYSAVYYAYFAPYTLDMHMHLVAHAQLQPGVRLEMLGETLDGHDLDMLVIGGEGKGKKKVWVIARQHPGETQAEWFVEGLLKRLWDRCRMRIILAVADLFLSIIVQFFPQCCPFSRTVSEKGS